MIVLLTAILVRLPGFRIILSDEAGLKEELCTNILRPCESATESWFAISGRINDRNRPFSSPGIAEYFNGTLWPLALKPVLNLKQFLDYFGSVPELNDNPIPTYKSRIINSQNILTNWGTNLIFLERRPSI